MASLKALKIRINSVKSTQKITKAMKMVAAAKLKRAQEAAEASRPYAERLEKVVSLFAGTRGYLDRISVGQVGDFEKRMLADLKTREPAILDAIRTDREIKKETEAKLVAFLDSFAKSFS